MIWLLLLIPYGAVALAVGFASGMSYDTRYDADEATVRGLFWPYVLYRTIRTGFKKFKERFAEDE